MQGLQWDGAAPTGAVCVTSAIGAAALRGETWKVNNMILLADFVPDAKFLLSFLGTIGFVVWLARGIKELFGKKEVAKAEVSFSTEFATKKEVSRMDEQIGQIQASLARLEGDGDERRRAIYSHIEHLRLEIKADIDGLKKDIAQEGREFPNRLIALLRNTGVIKDK